MQYLNSPLVDAKSLDKGGFFIIQRQVTCQRASVIAMTF